MSKHKHNPKGRCHRNVVGGILAAALALTIVVAAQLGGVDNSQFAADMASDCAMGGGTYDASTGFCQMPGGNTGGTSGNTTIPTCPSDQYWNGSMCSPTTTNTTPSTISCASLGGATVAPAECDAADQRKNACVSPSVWSGSNGGTCTAATTTTTACSSGQYWNGTACVSSTTTTSTTCPSGQYWDMGTNTCKSTTTTGGNCTTGQYWDNMTSTCKSTSSPTNYTQVDTVGACTTRYGMNGTVGVWNAATSTCSVPMYQPMNGTTQSGYPAGTCPNGTAYPAGTGFPPCGSMTTTTTTPTGTEAWKQTSSTACTSAGYFWGMKTNYCYSTQLEKSNAEGMTTTTTNKYPTDGAYTDSNPSQSCVNAGGSWVADAAAGTSNSGWCDMSNAKSTYTQPYNQPWSTQWKDPASYGKDPEGCKNAGFYYDDSKKDCFPSQGDFYSLGTMLPGTFGPMPTMPFGPGMQSGFFDGGNFTPPTWDSQQMTDQYSQYGFEADNYQFDDFQIDWDQEYQGPQIQNRKQEVKRITKEGKQKLREINQFEKEFERVKGRSGGNEACPAIANASAALSTAKAVVELMTNATEDTVEQAMTAQGQLFGNWETQGIWNDVMQAVQGAHQCEQLSQMQKDGGREVKQMTKELKRVKDAETKAFLESVLAEFSNVVANLGDYYQPCDGGFGPCDPMEEARFAMDDLRMSFWDTMRDQQDQFQYDDVCGNFDMIREHLSEDTDIPEEILVKASAMLNKGVAYCEDGNIDGATKVLMEMERMKNEFEGRFEGGEMEFGRDAQDYMRDAAELEFSDGEVDIDALMAQIEERFLSKLETAVQAAVDRVTQAFTLKIAQMESEFASRLAEFQAKALDNVNIGFTGELKDTIIESKTAVTEAVGDLDQVITAFEKEDVEIPADVQREITKIYELATVRNMTDEASQEFKAEIDAATNEVIIAFQEDPEAAADVLAEVIPELRDAGEKIYEGDKDAQLEGGILAFGDLHGQEDAWFTGWGTAAKNEGFINGQLVDGEKVMNANASTNWAEGLTMTARMVAGGEENIPDEVDLSNPVIREMPDWAQAPATYLISQNFIDPNKLAEIYGNNNPGDSMTRIEMMEVVADAVNLPAGGALDFPDADRLDSDAKGAASALVDAGVVGGEGDGNLNPDGLLNRAAFAKIIIGAQQVAGMERSSFPEPNNGGEPTI